MSKRFVNPAALFPTTRFGFSQAVRTTGGTTLHISGQTAWDANGQLVGGADLGAQTRQALLNVKAAIEAAGGSMTDVVALRIFVANYHRRCADVISSALRDYFPVNAAPAATWIGVQSLATPEFLVEIEATAVVD
jgi:enamine deaminase RidA (YjgF/YER057c/UK114 family)